MNTCLTIAGSDSGGEAGVQADLQVFNYFRCHALSVVTATTAQSYSRVLSINEVSADSFRDQLDVVFGDFQPNAIKTGMLVKKEFIELFLDRKPDVISLVVDPLMLSTSGTELLAKDSWLMMKDLLIPQASIVTPNYPELQFLLNSKESEGGDVMVQKFFEDVQVPVYLKGGHNSKAPSVDYFINSDGLWSIRSEELNIKASHGTGCRLSAALTAGLSKGFSGIDAAVAAKKYLHTSLSNYSVLSNDQAVMAPVSLGLDAVRVDLQKLL